MVSRSHPVTGEIVECDADEWLQLVETMAQRDFGVSAEEFARRYRAGEYRDPTLHTRALAIVMLLPDDRTHSA